MAISEDIPLQILSEDVQNPRKIDPESQTGTAYQKRFPNWRQHPVELPRQINRSQIEWITIGKTIGQGLFLKSTGSLGKGGPVGTLLAYAITSSIMYFILQSSGEIVTFRPYGDGVVGAADDYVDAALGFAMGWNAFYNWILIVPVQLAAASLLATSFLPDDWTDSQVNAASVGFTFFFLLTSVGANTIRFTTFARVQKYSTLIKIWAGIIMVITSLVISATPVPTSLATPFLAKLAPDVQERCASVFGLDGVTLDAIRNSNSPEEQTNTLISLVGDAKVRLGFKYWQCQPFVEYRVPGDPGRFLGTWDVLMQSAFSFQGLEVCSLIPGELKNPDQVVIPATTTVWREITALYLGGVFAAGLVVPSNAQLSESIKKGTGSALVSMSPFIIALHTAQIKTLPYFFALFFIESCWSAAMSGVFVSSRLIFLLAERGHAPRFLNTSYIIEPEHGRPGVFVPWVGVLISGIVSTLAFWTTTYGKDTGFSWLVDMTTCAAILHWVASLVAYLRFYHATTKAEQKPTFKTDYEDRIYRHRHRFQPMGALYALVMCILILVFNGWTVFTVPGAWLIAETPDLPLILGDPEFGPVNRKFITSYLPLPVFLLCFFGYKLIVQSPEVRISQIDWATVRSTESSEDADGDLHWTNAFTRTWRWLVSRGFGSRVRQD